MAQSYFPRMLCLIRSCNNIVHSGLTKFVWLHQEFWQDLSLPNYKVVNPGCTEKLKNICWPQSVNYMDVQSDPGVYLDMEIQLERKIGSFNDCSILSVLSTDHHSCSIQRYKSSVWLLPFDYYVKCKYFGFLLHQWLTFRKWDWIFLINVFL